MRYHLEWQNGSRERAIQLAREYIRENMEQVAGQLSTLSREEIVSLIDKYRTAGDEANRIVADMWLQCGYDGKRVIDGFALAPIIEPKSVVVNEVAELDRIKYEWTRGDRSVAIELAKDFINGHRVDLNHALSPYSLEELVALVERYRVECDTINEMVVNTWILAEYPPQKIVGTLDPKVSQFFRRG